MCTTAEDLAVLSSPLPMTTAAGAQQLNAEQDDQNDGTTLVNGTTRTGEVATTIDRSHVLSVRCAWLLYFVSATAPRFAS
jgi:hypothetical protein